MPCPNCGASLQDAHIKCEIAGKQKTMSISDLVRQINYLKENNNEYFHRNQQLQSQINKLVKIKQEIKQDKIEPKLRRWVKQQKNNLHEYHKIIQQQQMEIENLKAQYKNLKIQYNNSLLIKSRTRSVTPTDRPRLQQTQQTNINSMFNRYSRENSNQQTSIDGLSTRMNTYYQGQ